MADQTMEQKQFIKMTHTPIPPLILSLAIPTIISMLVSAIYSMADTFFVARLGTSAAGAVGIVFALLALIQAIGFMIGMGAGSQISRALGSQNYELAGEIGSSALFSSFIFGAFITIFGFLFMHSLLWALGSTDTILPYAVDYARYILLGSPILCASFVLNNLLRAEGKATFAMIGIAFGGILNIALDPLFIFVFHLGISGAAIATLLSQCISFFILLSYYLLNKTIVKLNFAHISRSFEMYITIIIVGLPSLFRQGLASIATAFLNLSAAGYGDPAIAAMSIVVRISFLIFAVMIGFGQGFQPVVGYNYGAKNYNRVKSAIVFSIRTGIIAMTFLTFLLFIYAPQLMTLFRKNDADVIAIGTYALRAQCLLLPFIPLNVISNMTFQVLGMSARATLLSSARQGIFFIPLIVLLPLGLGLQGVQLAQPIADGFSFFLCLFYMIPFFKELNKQIEPD